jgi:hypothetical protein
MNIMERDSIFDDARSGLRGRDAYNFLCGLHLFYVIYFHFLTKIHLTCAVCRLTGRMDERIGRIEERIAWTADADGCRMAAAATDSA